MKHVLSYLGNAASHTEAAVLGNSTPSPRSQAVCEGILLTGCMPSVLKPVDLCPRTVWLGAQVAPRSPSPALALFALAAPPGPYAQPAPSSLDRLFISISVANIMDKKCNMLSLSSKYLHTRIKGIKLYTIAII